MKGYLNTHRKADCFGCGACAQACPKGAISMEMDEEGFLYPRIDYTSCNYCNRCHKSCPAESQVPLRVPEIGIVGYNVEPNVRLQSASGGAFKAIIDTLDPDTVVFGARWETRSTVVHSWAYAEDAYEKFTGSKYVQSQIGKAYVECESFLEEGKEVLFSGTPCQIAALKAYLRKSYASLTCVDIVCHGVPCSKTLEKYISDKERRTGEKISSVRFRRKLQAKHKWNSKCVETQYVTGKSTVNDPEQDSYMRGFSYGLFFRPSCSECPFSSVKRCSDITIGDAWGIEQLYPEVDVNQGVSLLLANSAQGELLLNSVRRSMYLKDTPVEILVSGNAHLRGSNKGHAKRDFYFQMQGEQSFEKLLYRCIPKTSIVKLVGHRLKCALKKKKSVDG